MLALLLAFTVGAALSALAFFMVTRFFGDNWRMNATVFVVFLVSEQLLIYDLQRWLGPAGASAYRAGSMVVFALCVPYWIRRILKPWL